MNPFSSTDCPCSSSRRTALFSRGGGSNMSLRSGKGVLKSAIAVAAGFGFSTGCVAEGGIDLSDALASATALPGTNSVRAGSFARWQPITAATLIINVNKRAGEYTNGPLNNPSLSTPCEECWADAVLDIIAGLIAT